MVRPFTDEGPRAGVAIRWRNDLDFCVERVYYWRWTTMRFLFELLPFCFYHCISDTTQRQRISFHLYHYLYTTTISHFLLTQRDVVLSVTIHITPVYIHIISLRKIRYYS